ncbi:flagellar FlbD family protein [Microbacterium sp. CIAB417]|uniref:flagellar FlbD family protein n=1 Tax=Microbacterium sp. CIAB417 TaxID=2860287 RepID=UPI001FACE011|nr:flagellar FlbD family protein [Microbacterium sp. CIAB417]
MIVVTRLNRTRFAVNPDLIERIQASPDTTLIMVDGATFVITETMDEVIEQIIDLRARVLAAAARRQASDDGATERAIAGPTDPREEA